MSDYIAQHADENRSKELDEMRAWIEAQRRLELTEVNLGSWSGVDLRKMSEQIGEFDYYRLNYSTFSAAVHSMWHHVARYNLVPCDEPLHGSHNIAVIPELGFDPHYLFLTGKTLARTFRLNALRHPNLVVESAFDQLKAGLRQLQASHAATTEASAHE